MPKRPVRMGQFAFGGGMNEIASPYALADNELKSIANMHISDSGTQLFGRAGTRQVHSAALAASPITGMYVLGIDTGGPAEGRLVATCNTDLFYSGSLSTVPLGAFTTVAGTLSTGTIHSFAVHKQLAGATILYIADGGLLNKWNDATLALTENIAGTPSVIHLAVYNRRLFGIVANSDNLYYSEIDDGDSLGSAGGGGGTVIINTTHKQIIKALAPLGDTLFIFHTSSISTFTGWSQDDISIATGTRGASSSVGIDNRHSLALVNDAAYFCFHGEFFRLDADGTITNLSSGRLSPLTTADAQAIKGCVHLPATHEIVWLGTSVASPVYNYKLNAWATSTYSFTGGATLSATTSGLSSTNVPHSYFGGSDGHIREVEVGTTDDSISAGSGGSSITAVAYFRRMMGNDPMNTTALRFLRLLHTFAGAATVNIGTNEGTEAITVLAHANDQTVSVYDASVKGTYFDCSFGGSVLNLSGGKLMGVRLEGYELGDRF